MQARIRWRQIIGAAVFVGLLASFYVQRNVVGVLDQLQSRVGDFSNYYSAASHLISGRSPFTEHSFDYPPLLAFLIAPAAMVSYEAARLIWFSVSHALLLSAALLIWRRLGGDQIAAAAVTLAWTSCGVISGNLIEGQINPLLLGLLALALFLMPRAAPYSASAIGVATALKLWPGILLLAPVISGRRFRASVGAGVAIALVVLPLVAIFVFLPEPHLPASASYWMGTPAFLNSSIPAVVLRILDPPHKGERLPKSWLAGHNPRSFVLPRGQAMISVTVAASVLLLGCGLVWWTSSRANGDEREFVDTAALVAVALAASPVAWYHYQLFQLPAIAFLLDRAIRLRTWVCGVAVLVLGIGLTWTHVVALGPYYTQFGRTATSPVAIWVLTGAVPLLNLALIAILTIGIRSSANMARRHP